MERNNKMLKLIVLADDLTGALDTGIQFAKSSDGTLVALDCDVCWDDVSAEKEVLVIDTESRHIAPQEAYQRVKHLSEKAKNAGIPFIYKKTDSALRGHVGSELAAVLDATGEKQLHFIPAFPRTKRVTVHGIQYIDGIPVADSVFGSDPFNPVRHSSVMDVLAEETNLRTHSISCEEDSSEEEGILIYDAENDEDIQKRAGELKKKDRLHVMAGCAGFAAVLPELLDLHRGNAKNRIEHKPMLVVCGSVNPITVTQLDDAENKGFRRDRISPDTLLRKGHFTSEEWKTNVKDWADWLNKGNDLILDTNTLPGCETAYDFADQNGIRREDVPVLISRSMGQLVKDLIDLGVDATMLITGGDTLMGFMRAENIRLMQPCRELVAGTVLSMVSIHGKTYNIISKSGGFGVPTLISDLKELLQ
ncbi:four-carbon acid sugar kinase family protein [[Clostridium] aminophilum]|nr:four-carbon acid sugar kinase family protein [[Clostridium] aminophilum]